MLVLKIIGITVLVVITLAIVTAAVVAIWLWWQEAQGKNPFR